MIKMIATKCRRDFAYYNYLLVLVNYTASGNNEAKQSRNDKTYSGKIKSQN